MPEQSVHHQQDGKGGQQILNRRIGEQNEIDRQRCSGRIQCRN